MNCCEAAYNAIIKRQKIEFRIGLNGNPQLFTNLIRNLIAALDSRKDLAIERKKTSNSLTEATTYEESLTLF